jgi:hypothetical protein
LQIIRIIANGLLLQGEDVRDRRLVVALIDFCLAASPWPVRSIRIHGIRRARTSTLAYIREVVIIILRVNTESILHISAFVYSGLKNVSLLRVHLTTSSDMLDF